MRATRAFVVVFVSTTTVAGALQHDNALRYGVQAGGQQQQQAVLEQVAPPPASAAEEAMAPESTRRPYNSNNDDTTTLLTAKKITPESGSPSLVAVSGADVSISLSLPLNNTAAQATQATTDDADADDGQESDKDEGAAGPVAKASLFPLAIGLAAAVVML